MGNVIAIFLILLVSPLARGENAPAAKRTLFVLSTTDTSEFGLTQALQSGLGTLFQQTQYFNVQLGSYTLSTYSEPEVAKTRQLLGAELLSFAYLEKDRITLFLFDSSRPRDFVVASQPLVDPMLGNQINPQVIEYKLRMTFNQLITEYSQSKYQPLPGSETDRYVGSKEPDDPKVRAETARKLYRELAALQEGKMYLGATVGMARYQGTNGLGETASASHVDFGALVGTKLGERTSGELGLNFFNYVLLHADFLYKLPLTDKYLSFAVGVGAGMIMGTVAAPYEPNIPTLPSGAPVFGPSIRFDVPLLGANVRGELKFYLGGGMIILGTYGLSYSI